jgi:hypothetical protein
VEKLKSWWTSSCHGVWRNMGDAEVTADVDLCWDSSAAQILGDKIGKGASGTLAGAKKIQKLGINKLSWVVCSSRR